jgi:hypothetical protein
MGAVNSALEGTAPMIRLLIVAAFVVILIAAVT